MTKERYDNIRKWFLCHPTVLGVMHTLNTWLPRVVYLAYPVLLVVLAVGGDTRFWRVLLVPAVAFCGVTLLRKVFKRPRPYEKMAIEPLIPREKRGESFPSRHVASVTIIAVAFWYVRPLLSAAMGVVAVLIGVIRPLAGIHFPRDVLAGMAMSLVIGLIGFWVI